MIRSPLLAPEILQGSLEIKKGRIADCEISAGAAFGLLGFRPVLWSFASGRNPDSFTRTCFVLPDPVRDACGNREEKEPVL
jgi:hypothetical protein